jgi:hypothetical protein
VTELQRLWRIELALASYAIASVLVVLATGVDAVRFHVMPTLSAGLPVSARDVAVIGLAAADFAVVGLALSSAAAQVRRSSRFLAGLGVLGVRRLGGRAFVLVDDEVPRAFCAGLLKPRVHVSTAALRMLNNQELLAVLAHEHHHARRRDPLRQLLVRAFTRSVPMAPGLGRLADRHATVAELAADAVAIRRAGAPRYLASALVAIAEHGEPERGGIAPERVDHLLGRLPRRGAPDWALLPVALSLAVLSLAVLVGVSPGGWDVCTALLCAPAPLLGACAAVVLFVAPIWLVARSAAAAVQPCD